jgi:hypothetical protein
VRAATAVPGNAVGIRREQIGGGHAHAIELLIKGLAGTRRPRLTPRAGLRGEVPQLRE